MPAVFSFGLRRARSSRRVEDAIAAPAAAAAATAAAAYAGSDGS